MSNLQTATWYELLEEAGRRLAQDWLDQREAEDMDLEPADLEGVAMDLVEREEVERLVVKAARRFLVENQ